MLFPLTYLDYRCNTEFTYHLLVSIDKENDVLAWDCVQMAHDKIIVGSNQSNLFV